jgi:hypothetical protein
MLGRLTGAVARAPARTLAVIIALAAAGALASLSLRPSVEQDTLISGSSAAYRATLAAARAFGAAPVVVLVREPLGELLAPADVVTISRLEACIAGRAAAAVGAGGRSSPRGALDGFAGPGSPCAYLMRGRPVQVVYGPGTFVDRAIAAVDAQLAAIRATDRRSVARAARTAYRLARTRGLSPALARAAALAAAALEAQRLTAPLTQLALASGLTAQPTITDTAFVDQLVFGRSGSGSPRPRLAYLFPSPDAAVIQARLRAGLTPAQTDLAISAIRAAVAMPQFRLTVPRPYTVTGEPVVLSELATRLTDQVGILLGAAILAMALALAVVFGGPLSLLPLGVALATTAITYGALTLAGAGLTIASLAAVPILIGLAVDYAIQFQSRTREPAGADPRAAVRHAASRGAPTIAVAALATAAGFLVLELSPVPMVRGFGGVIVAGVGIALLVTMTACPAALALADSSLGVFGASLRGARELIGAWSAGARELLGAWLRGAGEILSGHPASRRRAR